jgi:phage major head subunit gpT-like protein
MEDIIMKELINEFVGDVRNFGLITSIRGYLFTRKEWMEDIYIRGEQMLESNIDIYGPLTEDQDRKLTLLSYNYSYDYCTLMECREQCLRTLTLI